MKATKNAAHLAETLGTGWLWESFDGQRAAIVKLPDRGWYMLFLNDQPGVCVCTSIARKIFGEDFERQLGQ